MSLPRGTIKKETAIAGRAVVRDAVGFRNPRHGHPVIADADESPAKRSDVIGGQFARSEAGTVDDGIHPVTSQECLVLTPD